jgi:hypothetical protein
MDPDYNEQKWKVLVFYLFFVIIQAIDKQSTWYSLFGMLKTAESQNEGWVGVWILNQITLFVVDYI